MVWRKGRDQRTRRLPKAGSCSNRVNFRVDACSILLDLHSLTSKCLPACSPKIRNLPTISFLQCMCILLYAHWDPGYCVQVCAPSEILLQWSEDWVCAKWDSTPVIWRQFVQSEILFQWFVHWVILFQWFVHWGLFLLRLPSNVSWRLP